MILAVDVNKSTAANSEVYNLNLSMTKFAKLHYMTTKKEVPLLDLLPQSLRFDNHVIPIVLSVLLFLVVKACLYKFSSSRFSKLRLPPGPKPLPVLGNMHQLGGAPLHAILHDLAKTYGPVCHLKAGRISIVSVTSSDVAKEILNTQELRFMQRPKLPIFDMIRFDRGSIAFCPYGEYWRQIRKVCVMELLSPGRVRRFESLREKEIANLVESVKRTSRLPFDVSEMIFSCANSVISKATFGQNCKRRDEFISAVKEQQSLAGQFSIPEIFPCVHFLYHLDGTKAKMSRFRAVYDDILGSVIADHRMREKSQDRSSSYEENFIDVLLRLQESAKTGNSLSLNDNTLKDIVLDMLIAGTDTWPTTVEWAMSELLKNPGIMKKAKTELQEALKGKNIVKEADLGKIQYLKQIIKETFRLHPPAAMLSRVPGEDCVVHGYDIPKGSRVLINTWSMGRDPNNWENPEKFEPERNLDFSIDLVGKYFEILPFGSGKRACAGAGFAVASIELMLANLIYCFDWELANGLGPDGLDMAEAPGMIIRRSNPLLVVATPHHTTA